MFNRTAYENSPPGGIGVLEVTTGEEEAPRLFVPLKRTELNGEVTGPLASLRLVQTYGYTREQSDKVLEAVYRFPLPGDAAVTGVLVRFGDVEIRAKLKARERAEADYEEAKQEGRQAALVTRESPDVFTLQVTGLQPDQEVMIETSYVQLARAEGSAWVLRVPLTTPPRYVRTDELTSRYAAGQPLAVLRDPGHRFALDLAMRGVGEVESSTHELAIEAGAEGLRVRLHDGDVIPDRDCVLRWLPAQAQSRPSLQMMLHDDAEHVYFLAMVAPPATHEPGTGVPREVILLVDHSGSMNGAKWSASDWAVETFFSSLTGQDALALGLFHNSTRWFDKKVRSADEKTVEAAVAFLLEHKDSGGTNLGVALEQALRIKRAKGECARHLLVVTDAQVSDAGRVLRLADEEAQRKDRRRISVLCIDAAPNAFLALELAERGGGAARFLTSSPDAEDITTALDEVLADWGEPVLSGVRLVANRSEVEAAGRQATGGAPAGWGAVDLGDLPAGRAIWVAGRVPRGDASDLAFRVEAAGAKEIAAYTPGDAGEARQCPAIKALFGARRVLGLEFLINSSYTGDMLTEQLKRLGYDPKTALKGKPGQAVYAENVREDVQEALRDLLVQEALDYGLASAETAFVAVREEAGEVIEGTVVVANALAEGWSDGFATLSLGAAPQGAMRLSASRSMDAAMFAAAPAPASAKHVRMRDQRIESPPAQEAAPEGEPLFDGVPDIANGEAVLFDSSRGEDAGKLPDVVTFSRLVVRFSGGAPKRVDRSLSLLVFVGDLSSPRARVRLSDLLRRGERPLNLTKRAGEVVRVVLVDPKGVWAQGAPQIEVSLGW